MRLLGDCKSNSPNNPKTAIGTSPNTSYWERIIEGPLEMLLHLGLFTFFMLRLLMFLHRFYYIYR